MKNKFPYSKEVCDNIFNIFTGTNENFRVVLQKPFKQKLHYFASDADTLVFLPIDKIELSYPSVDLNSINAEEIIKYNEQYKKVISVKTLKEKLQPNIIDEVIFDTVQSSCSECMGSGSVEYEYDTPGETYYNTGDCPICLGNGENKKEKKTLTGKKMIDENTLFSLHDIIFKYRTLNKLLAVCELLKIDKCIHVFGGKETKNIFICDEFTILLMPIANVTKQYITIQ